MNQILIYIPQSNSRIQYVVKLIFKTILGISYEITSDYEMYAYSKLPKMAYSQKYIDNGFYLGAHSLLFERGLKDIVPDIIKFENVTCLFKTNERSFLSFDIFAATFYLVTRYEEYLPHCRDIHGRFDAKESIAYKHDFLTKPVVNIWINILKDKLLKRYPQLIFITPRFNFIPTIDVDNAYAYLEKGLVRTVGAYIWAVLKLDIETLKERTNALLSRFKDPYDVFDYLIDLQKKIKFKPIYFFLIADYGHNDKNVPHTSMRFKSLIKSVGDYAEIGVHPSYASIAEPEKLKIEIKRLKNILHKDITKSRQHFLRIIFPQSYRNLIDADITDDYTMGYATEPGFRAGICSPYMFYDLDHESETSLQIHPFCIMEATFYYYKNTAPENVLDQIKPIIDEVRAVNGVCYSLWHNEFLSDYKEFKGWREVFESMIKYGIHN